MTISFGLTDLPFQEWPSPSLSRRPTVHFRGRLAIPVRWVRSACSCCLHPLSSRPRSPQPCWYLCELPSEGLSATSIGQSAFAVCASINAAVAATCSALPDFKNSRGARSANAPRTAAKLPPDHKESTSMTEFQSTVAFEAQGGANASIASLKNSESKRGPLFHDSVEHKSIIHVFSVAKARFIRPLRLRYLRLRLYWQHASFW
jgi:hypothetical protein